MEERSQTHWKEEWSWSLKVPDGESNRRKGVEVGVTPGEGIRRAGDGAPTLFCPAAAESPSRIEPGWNGAKIEKETHQKEKNVPRIIKKREKYKLDSSITQKYSPINFERLESIIVLVKN